MFGLASNPQFLYALKVIDLKGQLTVPLGTHLAELPTHPSLGKMVGSLSLLTGSCLSPLGSNAPRRSSLSQP